MGRWEGCPHCEQLIRRSDDQQRLHEGQDHARQAEGEAGGASPGGGRAMGDAKCGRSRSRDAAAAATRARMEAPWPPNFIV